MSSGLSVMSMTESDVTRFIAAGTHLGATNINFQMESYVYKRRPDGVHIIHLRKTYEKLLLAARAIAAIENPTDVYAISSRPMGQRAVLKFARHTGSTPIAGRFTPGAFTNQIQAAFREPRLLVVTDPIQDHQPISEASYVNIPVIAFCNTDSLLRYVDIAIPCNNKCAQSVGLMWWMLAREVLRLRGTISRAIPWESDIMPDLFFYRDPEEQEKEEAAKAEAAKEEPKESVIPQDTWGGAEPIEDVTSIVPPPAAGVGGVANAPVAGTVAGAAGAGAGAPVAAAPSAAGNISEDWGQSTDDWANPTGADDWAAVDNASWS